MKNVRTPKAHAAPIAKKAAAPAKKATPNTLQAAAQQTAKKVVADQFTAANRLAAPEPASFQHAPYRVRSKKIKHHRRLNALAAKASRRTEGGKPGFGLGSKQNRAIRVMKLHLKAAGYDPKSSNGVFDARTEQALRAFQKRSGLNPSGRVGPGTWRKLRSAIILAKSGTGPAQRRGERSAAVAHSEKVLKKLGYNVGKVDGLFDAALQRASRRFERKYRHTGDNGLIGGHQLKRMHQVLRARKHPGRGPTAKKGGRGAPVRTLQRRLKAMGFNPGGVDGVFGNNTKKAVKRFQRAFDLTADGVVGKRTWRMLGVRAKGKIRYGGVGGGAIPNLPGVIRKARWAAGVARRMGLYVTSTTGGTHAPGSYHYHGRAIDVAGTPARMAKFFNYMYRTTHRQNSSWPTELFYDPRGGYKHGRYIGAIGNHMDHVHVAF